MKKRMAVILFALLAMGIGSCGVKTTPEIIMPKEPMASSVADPETGDEEVGNEETGKIEEASEQENQQQTTASEAHTIYLITMDLADSYWKSIDNGCQKAVKELGNITYKWIGPDAHDDSLQSQCIDQAVEEGANAILVAANSAEGINPSLKKAQEAGCKIVYVDSAANYDCVTSLSTDNVAAGRTAGEAMMAALEEAGISEGTIGVIGVTADTASCVAREEGFRQAFEGTAYTLADTVFMQDNTENVKNAVAEGNAQGYVAYFGTNEGTTLAVGEAVKEGEGKSIVVGFDTSDAVLALVAEGSIYATMQQNPEIMGYDGMKLAVQALEGSYTDTNTSTDTGVTVITKDAM